MITSLGLRFNLWFLGYLLWRQQRVSSVTWPSGSRMGNSGSAASCVKGELKLKLQKGLRNEVIKRLQKGLDRPNSAASLVYRLI
ncbi:hypothetical protein ASPZODRAFT_2071155 [Penicilliopsis zonata CBS 506.65]|uniref:Uncharacterized protein n=1 Tax=Penicilliopsis zonata CBS 506.65 TaxID=1073090 RepID=A0A1L9SG18_9EURO|nr:hypothetical protein ASPZODRAFT_2071155 [Penicilliopsis zonata CBS 506.65]OJJ46180.1 hypothetical protein ASPZODRAFT_2071155 [Penicilliopsis zonata CBS 506.65]